MSVFSVSRSRCPASPLTAARKWTARQVFLQSCPPLWTSDDVLEVRGRAGEQQCDHDGSEGGISGRFVKGKILRPSANSREPVRFWDVWWSQLKPTLCLIESNHVLVSVYRKLGKVWDRHLRPLIFCYRLVFTIIKSIGSVIMVCGLFGDLGVQNSWPPSHDISCSCTTENPVFKIVFSLPYTALIWRIQYIWVIFVIKSDHGIESKEAHS